MSGMHASPGRIGAGELVHVLDALLATAESATLLLATGEGSRTGRRPRWLAETMNFTVTGLKSGSTVLEIEAPQLRNTASEVFAQQRIWPERVQPAGEETALDLAAQAIKEAQDIEAPGDRFDNSVLKAMLRFKPFLEGSDIVCRFASRDSEASDFSLDTDVFPRVENRLRDIPVPRASIVSGRLDEIAHGSGRFRLELDNGSKILGQLQREMLDIESLRPLWGKHATVQGMIYFKINGQPRLIKASRLRARSAGDNLFGTLPPAPNLHPLGINKMRRSRAGAFDPLDLAGTWPGDEPINELLAQLD